MMYHSFASWPDLLAFIRSNGALYYHAPLDVRPVAVCVLRVFKNGKLRICPTWAHSVGAFTVDAAHLPRFRRSL